MDKGSHFDALMDFISHRPKVGEIRFILDVPFMWIDGEWVNINPTPDKYENPFNIEIDAIIGE